LNGCKELNMALPHCIQQPKSPNAQYNEVSINGKNSQRSCGLKKKGCTASEKNNIVLMIKEVKYLVE